MQRYASKVSTGHKSRAKNFGRIPLKMLSASAHDDELFTINAERAIEPRARQLFDSRGHSYLVEKCRPLPITDLALFGQSRRAGQKTVYLGRKISLLPANDISSIRDEWCMA